MGKVINGKEFLEDMIKSEVIDLNNPKCKNCNECCGMATMLLESEYQNILKYIQNNSEGRKIFQRAKDRIEKHRQQGFVYFICPFSNENKRCDIYFIRPKVCREFHCSAELNRFDKESHYSQCTRVIGHFFIGDKGYV